jgi:hypothetical protein
MDHATRRHIKLTMLRLSRAVPKLYAAQTVLARTLRRSAAAACKVEQHSHGLRESLGVAALAVGAGIFLYTPAAECVGAASMEQLKTDLKEAKDAGDISLTEYLGELKSLREQQVEEEERAGSDAEEEEEDDDDDDGMLVDEDGWPYQTPVKRAKASEASEAGSFDDAMPLSEQELSDADVSEAGSFYDAMPLSEQELSDADVSEAEAPAEASKLKPGDICTSSDKLQGTRLTVVRIGSTEDFANSGRVYVRYQLVKKGCQSKLQTLHCWVLPEYLKVAEPIAAELQRSPPRSSARKPPPGRVDTETPTAALPARAAHERERKVPVKEAPVRGPQKLQHSTQESKVPAETRVKEFPNHTLLSVFGDLKCQACKKKLFNKWSSINNHCKMGTEEKPSMHAKNVAKWLLRTDDDTILKETLAAYYDAHPVSRTHTPNAAQQ